MFRKLIVGLVSTFMVGCASIPEALVTESPAPISDIRDLEGQIQQSAGQDVRLGGIIAAISNGQSQTRLEIVAVPIGSDARPKIKSQPQSRFVAYVDGFLEPMEYQPGRLITVAGKVQGKEQGKVGEYDYTYPVVSATGTKLWTVKQEIWIDDFDRFPPCFGVHCRQNTWYGGYSRGEVRERVTP